MAAGKNVVKTFWTEAPGIVDEGRSVDTQHRHVCRGKGRPRPSLPLPRGIHPRRRKNRRRRRRHQNPPVRGGAIGSGRPGGGASFHFGGWSSRSGHPSRSVRQRVLGSRRLARLSLQRLPGRVRGARAHAGSGALRAAAARRLPLPEGARVHRGADTREGAPAPLSCADGSGRKAACGAGAAACVCPRAIASGVRGPEGCSSIG